MRNSIFLLLCIAFAFVACGDPKVTDLDPAATDDDDDSGSDTTPPVVTIESAPAVTSTSGNASFTFTADEPATFECRLDSAAFAPCTSPQTLTGVAEGGHTFQVRATDSASNVGNAASHSWNVDIIPRYNPDIANFVSAMCSLNNNNCHGAGSGRSIATYNQLVNAAATGNCNGRTRVIPNDLANSVFHGKLTATPPCGGRMPQGTNGPGQANIDMVAEWIMKGARQN